MPDHYRAPGWFTRHVFNQLVAFLTRQGISVLGFRRLVSRYSTPGSDGAEYVSVCVPAFTPGTVHRVG
jgi:hypothetical protein